MPLHIIHEQICICRISREKIKRSRRSRVSREFANGLESAAARKPGQRLRPFYFGAFSVRHFGFTDLLGKDSRRYELFYSQESMFLFFPYEFMS